MNSIRIGLLKSAWGQAFRFCHRLLNYLRTADKESPPFYFIDLKLDWMLTVLLRFARKGRLRRWSDPILFKTYRRLPFSAPVHIEILSRRLIDRGFSGKGSAELGRVLIVFNWMAAHFIPYYYRSEKDGQIGPDGEFDTLFIFARPSFLEIAEVLTPNAIAMELEGFLFNPPGPENQDKERDILRLAPYWRRYYDTLFAWFGPNVEGDFIAWRGHPHMLLASVALRDSGHRAYQIELRKPESQDFKTPPVALPRGDDPFCDSFEAATGVCLAEAQMPKDFLNRFYTALPEIPIRRVLSSTVREQAELFTQRIQILCQGDVLFVETPYHSLPACRYEASADASVKVLSFLLDAGYSIDVKLHPDYGDRSLLDGSAVKSRVRYLPNALPGELACECYDTVVFFYSISVRAYTRGQAITLIEFVEGVGEDFEKISRGAEFYLNAMCSQPFRLDPDRYEDQLTSLLNNS